jgi:hypothetical protein
MSGGVDTPDKLGSVPYFPIIIITKDDKNGINQYVNMSDTYKGTPP